LPKNHSDAIDTVDEGRYADAPRTSLRSLLINGVQVNSTVDGQFDPARFSTKAIRKITARRFQKAR
jgi:hypothetical protein